MKCPNCGEEIGEGTLICEYCGQDIRMMTDFVPKSGAESKAEPFLEQFGEDISNGSWDETLEEMPEGDLAEAELSEEQARRLPFSLRRRDVFYAILVLVVLAAIGVGWFVYGYYSEAYQIGEAERYAAQGRYDEAIRCYGRALELDSANIDLMFVLAETYYLKNDKVQYEFYLREIVRSGKATAEQLDGAYRKLIGIYRDRGDYHTINTLLLASDNDSLISAYQNYVVREPNFSMEARDYTGVQQLKLTADGSGKIYYTLDGSEPTKDSPQYTAPILLEKGDYIVKAFFENERGIASEVASREYHIVENEILPPEISVASGEYHSPAYIEVVGDYEDVYYTTDGSAPTIASSVYTGPIPMPLGESLYKFVKIVDGVTGTVTERTYALELDTEVTPEDAVASVVEYSISNGKINDAEGHFDQSGNLYRYLFLYAANINEVDDFYVIAEIFCTADEPPVRTGNHFAVNVYTGERFKLQQDDKGLFSLIEIEN